MSSERPSLQESIDAAHQALETAEAWLTAAVNTQPPHRLMLDDRTQKQFLELGLNIRNGRTALFGSVFPYEPTGLDVAYLRDRIIWRGLGPDQLPSLDGGLVKASHLWVLRWAFERNNTTAQATYLRDDSMRDRYLDFFHQLYTPRATRLSSDGPIELQPVDHSIFSVKVPQDAWWCPSLDLSEEERHRIAMTERIAVTPPKKPSWWFEEGA